MNHTGKFPFYLLNPLISNSLGYKWWFQRLRVLIDECGHERVANNILCVELFPYHSKNFKPLSVPSQEYSFGLVRRAISRGAIIVQMRGRAEWFQSVSELQGCKRYFKLNSSQAVYVTPQNCPDGYPKIVHAIMSQL